MRIAGPASHARMPWPGFFERRRRHRALDVEPRRRPSLPRQTAGWPLMPHSVRGKSGLHGKTVPANGRRGRPQGQCHRKQTARARPAWRPAGKGETVRQPRPWQQGRHGKPHREQDRIGAAVSQGTGAFPLCRPGWSREARRKARPRGMVVPHFGADRTRLTGRLAFSSLTPGKRSQLDPEANETGIDALMLRVARRIAASGLDERP
jgi:hypothetical protein